MLTSPAWLTSRSSSGARTRTADCASTWRALDRLGRRRLRSLAAKRDQSIVRQLGRGAAAAARGCGRLRARPRPAPRRRIGAPCRGLAGFLLRLDRRGAGSRRRRRHDGVATNAGASATARAAARPGRRSARPARSPRRRRRHRPARRGCAAPRRPAPSRRSGPAAPRRRRHRPPHRRRVSALDAGLEPVRHLAQAHRAGEPGAALQRVQRAHAGGGVRRRRRARAAQSRSCAGELGQQLERFFLEDREQLEVDRVDRVDVVVDVAEGRRTRACAGRARLVGAARERLQLGHAERVEAAPRAPKAERCASAGSSATLDAALGRLGRRRPHGRGVGAAQVDRGSAARRRRGDLGRRRRSSPERCSSASGSTGCGAASATRRGDRPRRALPGVVSVLVDRRRRPRRRSPMSSAEQRLDRERGVGRRFAVLTPPASSEAAVAASRRSAELSSCSARRASSSGRGSFRKPAANWCSRRRISSAASTNRRASSSVPWPIDLRARRARARASAPGATGR